MKKPQRNHKNAGSVNPAQRSVMYKALLTDTCSTATPYETQEDNRNYVTTVRAKRLDVKVTNQA